MPYKKIAFFIIIFLFVITINDLAHSLYAVWQKQDLINQAEKNLDIEKQENQKLKNQITEVNQSQFIESEARNKLLLAKSGEGIVIIPADKLPSNSPSPRVIDTRPNWLRWLQLFFNS